MWTFINTLFIVVVAVATLLITQQYLHLRRIRNKINQRLVAMVENGAGKDHSKLFEQTDLLKSSNQGLRGHLLWNHLHTLYRQSGLRWSKIKISLTLGAVYIGCLLLYSMLLPAQLMLLVFSLLTTILLAYLFVARQRSLRLRQFTLMLPDALGIIVRSLRAGHPLGEGVRMVAEEMPAPMGSEFQTIHEQLAVGADAETAMINMYHQVGSDEVKLMAVTLSIQQGTGGNLAEVFEKLAITIRQRTMLAVKVKSISAEGRASATIMSVFPLILYAIISLASPGYFDSVWQSDFATHIVVACLAAIALGTFILMRMVDFDR